MPNKFAGSIYNIFTVPSKKPRVVSLTSSRTKKNTVVFPAHSRL